ncbi:MAG TPA: Rrf2 family transcriptional regulator [Micrococcaceae bacterium]|nr:Rrf2 family transcriptional regulator [Micrococcaceae bacterium]
MRINAFSDLCLRVVMLLASARRNGLLTSQQIADGVGVPYSHVSKAVIRLRELGLVDVTRGRSGGATISAAGEQATVGALLRSLDTRTTVADCHTPNGDCPMSLDCGLQGALARAREAFYAELDAVVISALPHQSQMGPVLVTLGTRRPA